VAVWKKVKVGDFLFEREGRYKPDTQEIEGLQRIDKIDFSGNFHIANKPRFCEPKKLHEFKLN
jgi:type I restriction enzyme S subunit